VVDLARVLLNFFKNESCGKCTPCRVGTHRAYDTLTRISEGQGMPGDIEQLLMLVDGLVKMSNCGLGQTAAVPIKDILKHFRAEVDAHINLKVCPAGVCPMVVEEAELA
jgi:NADH:ubiquinone oxidoreductase subunit F (NADH-binding)